MRARDRGAPRVPRGAPSVRGCGQPCRGPPREGRDRGAPRVPRGAPSVGGCGGPCRGPPREGRDRGAPRVPRGGPSVGACGGPCRGPPLGMTTVLLETRRLVKAFGGNRAVDAVEFTVQAGELLP